MISHNSYSYSKNSHASYLVPNHIDSDQSSFSSLDLIGTQSDTWTFAAGQDPLWFTDFILYESDDHSLQADPIGAPASGAGQTDMERELAANPFFLTSRGDIPASTNTSVPIDTGLFRWPLQGAFQNADNTVAFHSDALNVQWNYTDTPLSPSASGNSGTTSSAYAEQSSPGRSTSTQNDAADRPSVPRIPLLTCLNCQFQCSNKSRLCDHLQTSHAPPRFTCGTCDRGFRLEKDLRRHHRSKHEPKQPLACSCSRTYTRFDNLQRHVNAMALRPREAGRHQFS